ncbi:MAG TPA: hypothetical protein VH114_03590 [Candidatus Acidoferrum sp.]|nr:hypothetical protein [Candidatus Acidoferrum sp.]
MINSRVVDLRAGSDQSRENGERERPERCRGLLWSSFYGRFFANPSHRKSGVEPPHSKNNRRASEGGCYKF